MSVATPFLAAYGISYRYPGAGRLALDEFTFEIEKGEVLALLGPNGCGKSTLLKILSGVVGLRGRDCSGQVRYRGDDFLKMRPESRVRGIAYVAPQFRSEFPMTAEEAVSLGRTSVGSGFVRRLSQRDHEAVMIAMERCQCLGLRERDLNTLSGGELQLVALARALAQEAKVLLLDEALSKMDLHHQASAGKLLRQLASDGYAIVLVAHDLRLASAWADRGILMKAGKKIADAPLRDVLKIENLQKLYPGAQLVMGCHPVTGAPEVFFG